MRNDMRGPSLPRKLKVLARQHMTIKPKSELHRLSSRALHSFRLNARRHLDRNCIGSGLRSAFLLEIDAGCGNRISTIGVRRQRGRATDGEIGHAGGHFVRAVEHLIVGDLLPVCAAMRPMLVTRLASTPRGTSLYGPSRTIASMRSFHSNAYGFFRLRKRPCVDLRSCVCPLKVRTCRESGRRYSRWPTPSCRAQCSTYR